MKYILIALVLGSAPTFEQTQVRLGSFDNPQSYNAAMAYHSAQYDRLKCFTESDGILSPCPRVTGSVEVIYPYSKPKQFIEFNLNLSTEQQ